jgi:glycosyltransferase involved in cell wall biosynthesis
MKPRVLIVIPAYNEEKTIAGVIEGLRQTAPDYDRVVVNDGAGDRTGQIVAAMSEKQLWLPCNLGYGNALQTGLKYGLQSGYDIIVSFDGDGQHRAEDVQPLVDALLASGAHMVIGSRYCNGRSYNSPLGRKLGQLLFSQLTRLLIGRRIYDTTSGFKAMRAAACEMVVGGVFMDFHTESLVRLSMAGLKIIEHPITVYEREHGRSMHSLISVFAYPLQTLLLTLVATVDALLTRRTS